MNRLSPKVKLDESQSWSRSNGDGIRMIRRPARTRMALEVKTVVRNAAGSRSPARTGCAQRNYWNNAKVSSIFSGSAACTSA